MSTASTASSSVAIVGAGIIGLATAVEMAQSGINVDEQRLRGGEPRVGFQHVHDLLRITPLALWNARAAGHDAEQIMDVLRRALQLRERCQRGARLLRLFVVGDDNRISIEDDKTIEFIE